MYYTTSVLLPAQETVLDAPIYEEVEYDDNSVDQVTVKADIEKQESSDPKFITP